MDFTAHPARLVNNCRLFFIWVAAVLGACTQPKNTGKAITRNDTALQQQGGFLLYNGIQYNGLVLDIAGNDTLYSCQYKNGKQEGWETINYPGGKPMEKRYYEKGRREREHRGWHENGSPRFVYNYKADAYEGNVKEWLESGQLVKDFNYKNGHENGRQRLWYADGKIMANYDVRNGRKYGLTGVKNCINVHDADTGVTKSPEVTPGK